MHWETRSSAKQIRYWRLRTLLSVVLVLGCQWAVFLTIAIPASPPQGPALWVHVRDGRLSIEATATAWVYVLHEVHRQTGIRLHLQLPLAGTVTVSMQDLPVEQALRRLFGPDASVSFLYPMADPSTTSPTLPSEVWVFGKGQGHIAGLPEAEGELSPLAGPDTDVPREETPEARLTALEASAEQSALEVLQQGLDDPNRTVQMKAFELSIAQDGPGTIAFLTHMAKSDDPATRMQALFLLYDSGLANPAVPIESVFSGDESVIVQEQELPLPQEPSQ